MSDYSSRAHFGNYDPSSFGWSRSLDLVPFVYQGVNFGQCARAALPVFTALLDELVPHIPGGIVAVRKVHDDWAYSATDDLPDGSWSFHHYGIAFDLDWQVNPMGTNIPDGQGPGSIPRDWAMSIARKYGCEWGGNWSGGFHDLMHFEIHLSPADARTVVGPTVTDPLEQIMAMYASKADFEAAMQRIVNSPAWNTSTGPHSPDTVIRAAVGDHVDGAVKLLAEIAPRVAAIQTSLATVAKTVAGLPSGLAGITKAVAAIATPPAAQATAADVKAIADLVTTAVSAKLNALTWKVSA